MNKQKLLKLRKILLRSLLGVIAAGFLVAAIASAQILSCYFTAKDIPEDSAVIILGCGLSPFDHTTPSTMLTLRLEAAVSYLETHPGAAVVLSGGQGADELVSEAEAMRRWFETRGYDLTNFLLEDKSVSTAGNLSYSYKLLEEQGLTETKNAVIVTDGFHQFRAHSFAKTEGLIPYTVASYAPVHLQTYYWLRELAGIVLQVWL